MIIEVLLATIQVMTILIILRALASFLPLLFPRFDMRNPVMEFLITVTDPVLLPIRSVLPSFGGFDFSPLVAVLVLQFLYQFLAESQV